METLTRHCSAPPRHTAQPPQQQRRPPQQRGAVERRVTGKAAVVWPPG